MVRVATQLRTDHSTFLKLAVQTYMHAVIQICTDKVCLMEEDMPNKDANIIIEVIDFISFK